MFTDEKKQKIKNKKKQDRFTQYFTCFPDCVWYNQQQQIKHIK